MVSVLVWLVVAIVRVEFGSSLMLSIVLNVRIAQWLKFAVGWVVNMLLFSLRAIVLFLGLLVLSSSGTRSGFAASKLVGCSMWMWLFFYVTVLLVSRFCIVSTYSRI